MPAPDPRPTCHRCLRPLSVCWCADLAPLETRTRVVFLQHPCEARVAIGTARIGRLPVPGSGSALAAYLSASLDELSSGAAEIRLSDRRRVALRAVSCQPGELRLLFATLPAASP